MGWSEPGAVRGPQAGSPLGVVVATGSDIQTSGKTAIDSS